MNRDGDLNQVSPAAAQGSCPAPVAIVASSNAPYRLHVHRRIAREAPEVRLFSVFTHEQGPTPWPYEEHPEIGSICFGPGESVGERRTLRRLLRDWRRGGRIIRWLEERDVQAVFVGGYNDPGMIRIMRHFKRRGVPVLFYADSNIHGDRATGLRRIVKRAIVPRVLRWADMALPFGSLGERYFEAYGVPKSRMVRWPCEPDYAQVRSITPAERDAARVRFNLDPTRRRIVYCGRLAAVKRVDLLLRAFAAIAERRPDWDLVLVGDGPLRTEIEASIDARLRGRVAVTGFVGDQRTVSALYNASDVLALPSDYEPWGLVVNEAVGAGLAVVTTLVVGAAAELVRDGVNGRLIPPGDEAALVEGLLDVTAPDRIDRMKAASAEVLEAWRRSADPVLGFRKALRATGVLRASQTPPDDDAPC